jgi:hypothetical protein
MKAGDILIFTGVSHQYYTHNKYYRIYKVDNFIRETTCFWIYDDEGDGVYFRGDMENKHWISLKLYII